MKNAHVHHGFTPAVSTARRGRLTSTHRGHNVQVRVAVEVAQGDAAEGHTRRGDGRPASKGQGDTRPSVRVPVHTARADRGRLVCKCLVGLLQQSGHHALSEERGASKWPR
jgi:hypothetical protein